MINAANVQQQRRRYIRRNLKVTHMLYVYFRFKYEPHTEVIVSRTLWVWIL